MQPNLELALIYGSARPGRFCDTVAQWTAARIDRHGGFTLDVIDPLEPETAAGVDRVSPAAHAALRHRIGRADAFVVVTPEYNHSFTAPLKALIDSAFAEWQAKPVAFVSYGGVSGGLRAVEHLRLVFAELHAVGIRDGVSFAGAAGLFYGNGHLHEPERHARSAARMLEHLAWWARALKRARDEHAYAEVAA